MNIFLSDVYKDKEKQTCSNNPNILRGDVSLKLEAKIKREKSLHDKMLSKTYAAEVIIHVPVVKYMVQIPKRALHTALVEIQ